MFAFALHDAREGSLYLVRDRAGIKPLYYYHGADRLLFGSEIQALLRADGFPRVIDEEGLSGYFRYQYVPAPRTTSVSEAVVNSNSHRSSSRSST